MMRPLGTGEMIPLLGDDGPPDVGELAPDVRSGTTFTYTGNGNVADSIQFVLIVWIYTIDPSKHAEFALKVSQFESDPQQLPPGSGVAGVDYRGTYSVSVSSASPDFEYRTFWGLEDLSKIKDLNDYLRRPLGKLQAVLGLIAKRPPLRAEIMGLTRNSAPISGTTSFVVPT